MEKVGRVRFKKVLLEGYLRGVRKIKVKSELDRNGEKKSMEVWRKRELIVINKECESLFFFFLATEIEAD